MGSYSIRDLEQLSGIKAHTIRIWEQRYQLLSPHRTSTNIRFYDDDQLKKLLNVSALLDNGWRISKVSGLTQTELHDHLSRAFESAAGTDHSTEYYIHGLIVAMLDLDERKFNTTFNASRTTFGFKDTITRIIYPFLEKVGFMWGIDEVYPAQEHFIANLIRQKILAAIDELPDPDAQARKFLLFLPEGEQHELGLLVANFLIQERGNRTFYLGQNVPLKDIEAVVKACHPQVLVTFLITPRTPEEARAYLLRLGTAVPDRPIYLSGRYDQVEGGPLPENINWLRSPNDLEGIL
ncbi:MAG: MerR family transcriptional regulator [Bacteroidota bacterium]